MSNNIRSEVSITLNASIDKVWQALTDPEIIKQYLFGTKTITDWKAGSPIRFVGEWQGKQYEDKGMIIAIEKNKLIKYSYWSSMSGKEDKPENYVIVTYELSGNDNNITLTISQENIADEKTKAHSEENWKMVLNGIKDAVENRSVSHV